MTRTTRSTRRRLLTTAAAGLLTAASLLVASPANAACPQTGCDRTDPIDTGCSTGAQNATYNPAYIRQGATTLAVVELRWSPSCGTNWGKIYNRVSPNNTVRVWVYRQSPYATTTKYGGTGYQYYGDQLDGQNATVCAVGEVTTPSGTKYTSTPLCA
ncbi:DUF2690 domain-containing protein [Micromonospora sp. WMMA1363]|uniref:DUF2690 domain-containing protein n=1 Tax=Micromonospora sp. WMMA1363 TaxID=3053985 RepID=UPI00259CE6A4|nr:DUF2690 domain-containing protein [Micromonospora sp. WMMA1363]MDM4722886.1 DUF2690 domain-containing protein [Micromonospora sp. WMMA1363]